MNNLKQLRKNEHLTQQKMADLCGITLRSYQNYENGLREMSYSSLIKLADFFNCSTDYLLGRRTSLSEIKQQLINIISNLDDDLCSLAEAYIEGLKTTQKQRDMVRARVSQQNNNIEEDID